MSALNAVNATQTNNISTASLMITVTALTVADSLAPRISSTQHIATSTAAGMLMIPPSPGGAANASGSCQPTVCPSRELRYSPHPTATAEAATPYSRTRHAPTTNATNSPRVA